MTNVHHVFEPAHAVPRPPTARCRDVSQVIFVEIREAQGECFIRVGRRQRLIGCGMPSLRCVDEAMRRRLHLVPFRVTIPLGERDPTLSDKLKSEWAGILAWAIEGCQQWQKLGLKPPQAVQQATAQYFEAEDSFTLWLEECCEKTPDGWESSSTLFNSWKEWATNRNEAVGTRKTLAHSIEAKGFASKRKNKARGFAGIRLFETAQAHLSPFETAQALLPPTHLDL